MWGPLIWPRSPSSAVAFPVAAQPASSSSRRISVFWSIVTCVDGKSVVERCESITIPCRSTGVDTGPAPPFTTGAHSGSTALSCSRPLRRAVVSPWRAALSALTAPRSNGVHPPPFERSARALSRGPLPQVAGAAVTDAALVEVAAAPPEAEASSSLEEVWRSQHFLNNFQYLGRRSDETQLERLQNGARPVADTELGEDARRVVLDRALGRVQG